MRAERRAVGLTAYPEMVVRHPGMRVHRPRGLPRPFGPGPQIQKSWKAKPDGLLLQEGLVWHRVCGVIGALRRLAGWNSC
jgi:hypothetical protein